MVERVEERNHENVKLVVDTRWNFHVRTFPAASVCVTTGICHCRDLSHD